MNEKNSIKKWETISSYYALDNKFMKIRRECVRLPDGTIYDEYYVNEEIGWVAIFCITNNGQVVLNKQYKHGIRQVVLELPAGNIEIDDSSPKVAAVRELEEETGYISDEWEEVTRFIIDPTKSTGYLYIFLARNARRSVKQKIDIKEIINVELVPINQVIRKVRNSEISVQGHVASIYYVLDKLGFLATI